MNNRFNYSSFSPSDNPVSIGPGTFLVASPALKETPFARTVVLVLQDNSQGTFGVVLNRPANEKIKTAFETLVGTRPEEQCVVHGGPIGGPVLALHQESELGDMEVLAGVFLSATSEDLQHLTQRNDDNYRVVFGLTGWKPGQLDNEIGKGLWYQVDANAASVFGDSNCMWESSMRKYAQHQFCDVVGLDRLPDNPSLN